MSNRPKPVLLWLVLFGLGAPLACGDNEPSPLPSSPPQVLGGAAGAGAPGNTSGASAGGASAGSEDADSSAGASNAGEGGSAGSIGASGAAGAKASESAERWLAYLAEYADSRLALFVAPVPTGGEPIEIAQDVESFEWSSDGQWLLFVTRAAAAEGGTPNGAYLVPFTTGAPGQPQLLSPSFERQAKDGGTYRVLNAMLSPNGQWAALHLYEDGVSRWYVQRGVPGDPDHWQRIGEDYHGWDAAEAPGEIQWRPDGEQIAVVQGVTALTLTVANSRAEYAQIPLIDGHLLDWEPFAPRRVLVDYRLGTTTAPRVLALVGLSTPSVPLTPDDGSLDRFSAVTWSDDGRKLLFKAEFHVGPDVIYNVFSKTLPSDPGEYTRFEGMHSGTLAWLNDDQRFVFSGYYADEASGPNLYVSAGNEPPTRLNPTGEYVSAFERLGDHVIFATRADDATPVIDRVYLATMSGPAPEVELRMALPPNRAIDSFQAARDRSSVCFSATDGTTAAIYYLDQHSLDAPEILAEFPPGGRVDGFTDRSGLRWSSDSKWFQFAADDRSTTDRRLQLFVSDLAGSFPRKPRSIARPGHGASILGGSVRWQP